MTEDAPALVPTGDVAKALGVRPRAIQQWVSQGRLKPDATTPGGRYRWDLQRVLRELRGDD